MTYGIRLKVWGDYACFTRPEMKVERVSYESITPSAARGVLEAIYWKPSITWKIDRIHVLNPIRFVNVRRNEIDAKIPVTLVKRALNKDFVDISINVEERRQQRAAMILRDVSYIIEAHFESNVGLTPEEIAKHRSVFERRAKNGQCFHTPYLGCREFTAKFEWMPEEIPISAHKGIRDLGWMLFDIDYQKDMTARFFRAVMKDGVIEIDDPIFNRQLHSISIDAHQKCRK